MCSSTRISQTRQSASKDERSSPLRKTAQTPCPPFSTRRTNSAVHQPLAHTGFFTQPPLAGCCASTFFLILTRPHYRRHIANLLPGRRETNKRDEHDEHKKKKLSLSISRLFSSAYEAHVPLECFR